MVRWWFLLLLLVANPVLAAEPDAVVSPRATVALVAERAAIAPGETFRLLLHQRLAPGWHTYWTNPGDAGAPPELRLDLPEGWRAGPLRFPTPRRIPYGPLLNFGYTGEAGFLMELTPPPGLRPGDTVTLEAEASWLICAELCIPEEGRFTLTLPVAADAVPANMPRFAAAGAGLPRPGAFAARIAADGSLMVEGTALSRATLRGAEFFPLQPGLFDNPAPQRLAAREGGLTLKLARTAAPLPTQVEGVLVLTDAAGARSGFEIAAGPGAVPGAPLLRVLGLALLGGLVLNLMPCVFPILAMKAVALARLGGAAQGAVRREAAGYTAGVVLGFLGLGGALLAVRAAGTAAGWGFQLTHPGFVAAMAWLMLAVGLNLSGAYAVRGPSLGGVPPRWGSFGTGLLAVAVATPCTAPFMASAIGAALVLPPAQALTVFAAMGLGLALPYALLALRPGLARALPRPGAWMERLRQFLAFPMYAAAAWLVWVLAQQAGPDGVLLALGGGVLVALAAWALGVAQEGGAEGGTRLGRFGAAAALLAALALLPFFATTPAAARPGHEAWSAARVAELQAEGRPVFVNFTAAWCISCKVNEALVLDTAPVRQFLAARNVAVLTGDWTRGDAAITALLQAQGRDGVPLYLLYPPGEGPPLLLPQILTEATLREAVGAF